MNTPVPEELLAALKGFSRFVLIGHEEPDGDCLSSQKGLGSFLRRRGGDTVLVSPGPFTKKEISRLSGDFSSHIPDTHRDRGTLSIVLDCSTIDRIGYLAEELGETPTAVIDHHSSGRSFGDIKYIDQEAPSVTYMVQKIITAMGDVPQADEAETLLFGLCTDTGFFRHLESESAPVFESAAELVKAGASPKRIHAAMYGGRTLASRTLLGILLSRTEALYNGRLLVTYETLEEKEKYGEENRDSDTLYRHLQEVEGCQVVLLIREESPGECSAGLRSNNHIDVGKIAGTFGGGGHAKAAGFMRYSTIKETLEAAVESIGRVL
ncbi:MAG: DHH family phosphoesterase [Spirochaetaceae bacterium]